MYERMNSILQAATPSCATVKICMPISVEKSTNEVIKYSFVYALYCAKMAERIGVLFGVGLLGTEGTLC